jgi:hypothetical protein
MRSHVLVLIGLLTACNTIASEIDPLAQRVHVLVNQTIDAETEAAAFAALEDLGTQGAPYIVAHLDDFRALPIKAIALENKSPDAFEGLRHYGPQTVHDALSAILNQVTGENFEFVYNGASSEVRHRNSLAWRAWCVKSYPQAASICQHGI